MKIHVSLRDLARDERGQNLTEYALMAVFAAFFAIVFIPKATSSVRVIFAKLEALMGGVAYVAAPTLPQIDIISVVCAALALAFLGFIILRRHRQATDE